MRSTKTETKKKPGRPKGSGKKSVKKVAKHTCPSMKVSESVTEVSGMQLALVQLELTNKVNAISIGYGSLAKNFEDVVIQVNKTSYEFAKRIQVLENRCNELEKLVCKDLPKDEEKLDDFNN